MIKRFIKIIISLVLPSQENELKVSLGIKLVKRFTNFHF